MRFLPYHLLGGKPNIIVDGSPNQDTILTLSHWPKNKTPEILKADLSVEIVFRYLENSEFRKDCEIVSNNHFDEDGLVSVYSLVNPEHALENRTLLENVARAGDFTWCEDRQAARIAYTLSAFADSKKSPFDRKLFSLPYRESCGLLYESVLKVFPDIIENTPKYNEFWKDPDELFERTERFFDRGDIKIEEYPELGLAVIQIKENFFGSDPRSLKAIIRDNLSLIPVYNRTKYFRIIFQYGKKFFLLYRYESWVDFISYPLLPRLDLGLLAESLNRIEKPSGKWKFEGIEDMIPSLKLTRCEESSIPFELFLSLTEDFFVQAKG
ncbi:MAG: hypothetical protein K8R21_15520 [Leptospira sp.]|nr:hypothetical protein [Leptospira sp.]